MDRLGLTTLLRARPQPAHLAAEDPDLDLAERDSDRCCYLRKTLPMISVLRNYDCVLTGRKRFQTAERAGMDYVEVQETWLRSEEHTSEIQSLMHSSYAVFCLKKKNKQLPYTVTTTQ